MQVKGYRIHYNVVGPKDGRAVVLVHGLGGRAEDWLSLSPYLVKAGCRVYTPDLPGFGRSERPMDFSYSVPAQAAMVVGFLDAMGLKQVDLGGWSMGGWIAQRVAAEHPERVRRLMLLDSAGLAEVPAWNTGLFTPTTRAEVEQLEALLMPHPPRIPAVAPAIAIPAMAAVLRPTAAVAKATDEIVTTAAPAAPAAPGTTEPFTVITLPQYLSRFLP